MDARTIIQEHQAEITDAAQAIQATAARLRASDPSLPPMPAALAGLIAKRIELAAHAIASKA